jgi:type IV pilus assembly protein PilC
MNNFLSSMLASVSGFFTKAGAYIARKTKGLNEAYAAYERSQAPRLSIKEQMFFFKRLSFLITAGVPILECLTMIAESSASPRYKRVVNSVIADVANGSSLAKSLARFPDIFGDFGINLIKIGESSGTLSQNLEYLADELYKRNNLQSKVASAFVYPAVITLATFGITGFLVLYLFPKIMPIFSSLHMDLPFTTKVVIGLSMFLQQWGLVLLAALIALFIGTGIVIKRSPRVRHVYHAWLLRAPVVGTMFRSYNLANASRTLGILLQSGVNLSEALPLTADTTNNLVYKKEYRGLAEAITRGDRISTYILKSPVLFPSVMTQMVSVGERSGSLSTTLIYLSELYESEVEDFTKNLASLIEPAMMVIMGILVGFVAISIITPIYGITQNLHN